MLLQAKIISVRCEYRSGLTNQWGAAKVQKQIPVCVYERENGFNVWLKCRFQSTEERMDYLRDGFKTVSLNIWGGGGKRREKSHTSHI